MLAYICGDKLKGNYIRRNDIYLSRWANNRPVFHGAIDCGQKSFLLEDEVIVLLIIYICGDKLKGNYIRRNDIYLSRGVIIDPLHGAIDCG